jgi:hypothetical protein
MSKKLTSRIGGRNDFIQADSRKKPDSERIVLTYPVGQKLIAKKESKADKFDLLINKKDYTCNNLIKGVSAVFNGMLIISHSISQGMRYEIPIYFMSQNYHTILVMDISMIELTGITFAISYNKIKKE